MVDRLKLDDLQSYGGVLDASPTLQAPREKRQSDRKTFCARAVLSIDGMKFDASTVDISAGGLCIRSARQIAVGKECQVSFDLPVDGELHPILADIQVIYCFYTSELDCKAGVEFLNTNAAGIAKIRRFVASPDSKICW